jgi:Ser/Thr protein kinase RdoA (MazF antagonist)
MLLDARQAAQVLTRYGLADSQLRVLADLHCTVFEVESSELPGAATRAALKIYPEHRQDSARVQAEVDWLAALRGETDLRVPEPLGDLEGQIIQDAAGESGSAARCVLFSWVDGVTLDAELTPFHLTQVGRFVGAMHAHSQQWARRNPPSTQRSALARWSLTWILEAGQTPTSMSARDWNIVVRAAEKLTCETEAIGTAESDFGFIHGDLYLSHFLFDGNDVGAIDFSDCAWGHFADDIATLLVHLQHPLMGNFDHSDRYPAFRDAFLEGYSERCTLSDRAEASIAVYVSVRIAVLVTLVAFLPEGSSPPAWVPDCLTRSVALLEAYLQRAP